MGTDGNSSGFNGGNIEVSSWLKGLAVAPEYHPTLAEFQDPIAYIFKIEKEASRYGICKIVPPVAAAAKKTAISNLNRSLVARSRAAGGGGSPTFTSRQQQIGFCPRKHHLPVKKPVWQSGETYTVQEFEAKAKGFEKVYLKKFGKKPLNALEMETLYWKATLDKPFSVEYANDMPGSAFSPRGGEGRSNNNSVNNCNVTVGETEWNMRGVSRAKGSLLRFMKEEIPGVTSPMVYIAMMFSWFAWHVEDHDLHSLNYLHMGAGKTWYGVPRDAAVAFEDVIRVQGYGGEINPLVTFATLGEKTTVMSPEVLIQAGVPCCRLVQNPGEFVVTFPGAYHSGFSHGFNCGEAANIATPEWLTVAKDAAIRRASINLPPMVSHFQLLYDLALSFFSRVPKKDFMEPRSSRLKDKKKDEGETLVKDQFVQDVFQNNALLHFLSKGTTVVVLPRISLSKSNCLNQQGSMQSKVKDGLVGSLCSPDLEVMTRRSSVSGCSELDRIQGSKNLTGSQTVRIDPGGGKDQCDRVTSQGLFSCTTCGLLCFASVAIVQPTETASQYLMSGDCSIFSDWGTTADCSAAFNDDVSAPSSNSSTGLMVKRTTDGLFDVPIKAASLTLPPDDENEVRSSTEARKQTSSLGLLALNYGDSDSDDDEADVPVEACETNSTSSSPQSGYGCDNTEPVHYCESSYDDYNSSYGISLKNDSYELTKAKFKGKDEGSFDHSMPKTGLQHFASICSLGKSETMTTAALVLSESTKKPFAPRADEDSSRMHIFCLQHAVQVEEQLQSIGGAHVVLLCHPDYPALEAQAKKVAEELGNNKLWSDISFREARKEDEEMIQLALDSEEAIHGNGDWAVKLGINLCYSANLSRSPLYSKQMPYNRLIYSAFGCRSIVNDVNDAPANGKLSGRHRRIVVAGKWCGKVWMSNQVHHLLAEREYEGQELERNIIFPVKADLKLPRPSEGTRTAEAAPTIYELGWKRKTSSEARSFFKAESLVTEPPEEDFENPLVSAEPYKDNLRNKRMKKETKEPRMRSVRNGKQIEAEDSEEDFEVMSISGEQHNEDSEDHSEGLPVSGKQHDSLRNKRMKKETPERQMKSTGNDRQVEADDSEEDFEVPPVSSKQHRDNIRSKWTKKEMPEPQMKSLRDGKLLQENSDEDLDVLPVSTKQRKSNMRNKRMSRETPERQVQSLRRGKQLGEDSEEDFEVCKVSGKQHGDNLRVMQKKKGIPESLMKSVRNDRQLEEDSQLLPVTGQRLKNNPRKKRTKRGTLEPQMISVKNSKQLEEDSEEDFEDVSGHQLKDNLRNKRMKKETLEPLMRSVRHGKQPEEDSKEDSEEDFEDVSGQQLKNNLRNKRMKKETLEPLMRSVRHGKQPEEDSEEDSEEDFEDVSGHQLKNNLRNKRMKKEILEPLMRSVRHGKQPEEDSEEDSEGLLVSGKQHRNNPRNKPMKETPEPQMKSLRNRKKLDSNSEDIEGGPSTRLRKRTGKPSKESVKKVEVKPGPRKLNKSSKAKKVPAVKVAARSNRTKTKEEAEFKCDLEGCSMSFGSKQELILHKKNICPVKGCGKKFFSHKYLIQHRRVHLDDRPLKCPWKGCKMTFKWAWARTEHIRVHTGARPYVCAEPGCGQTFRFVSDFSRHKRKTGHISKKVKK